jgi:DNA segregation ATPase FtsK/SpoIIIE, S-DNA-T family
MAKKAKKKKPLPKKKKKETVKKEKLPSSFKKVAIAVSFLLGTIVVSLSLLGLAGPAGGGIDWFLSNLGGRTVILFPFFLIGLVILFLQKGGTDKLWLILLGLALLEGGASGLLAVNRLHQGSLTSLEEAGGWLGQVLAWPFFHFFGLWVSLAFFIALTITGMIALSYPLYKERQRVESDEEEIPVSAKESPLPKTPLIRPQLEPEKEKINSSPKVNFLSFKAQEGGKPAISPIKKPKKGEYVFPPTKLLSEDQGRPKTGNIEKNSTLIEKTLADFGVPIEMVEVSVGPTVTQYAFRPSQGIKLSKITTLSRNIALALAAHPIRIEAPIPGKSLVGIEVPNQDRMIIRLRNLLEDPRFKESKGKLRFCLGRDVRGEASFADLAKMPHLLVAGATGAGKTVFLNNFIASLLYQCSPQEMNFILIDPKRVEFGIYKNLPHLLSSVISDFQEAVIALEWLAEEMERRFRKIAKFNTRDISSFNHLARSRPELEPMPFIVLVIDELADLMTMKGREIEAAIVRLAQKSRAVGIHLVLATQRPSVEVITGLIKANISCRISFQVASQVDSRTILDGAGAEQLLGEGDMLFLTPQQIKPVRIQSPFISEKETLRVSRFIKENNLSREISPLEESLMESIEESQQNAFAGIGEKDPLYERAKEVVLNEKRASASLLQRRLSVGYARAARLLDNLEAEGVIGPARGSKARKINFGYQEENNDEDEQEEEY